LKVQTAHDTLTGPGVIILNEFGGKAKLTKLVGPEGFHKEAALVTKCFGFE
jgi:hypothetical protein